ncbi:head maturation protease, ClpP-related [Helicovermis profundi]|uniref:ATP-dependent Clp protease proteolytic subunit n=1 Tax=Helicovermis profundi TaxID=3065157 RepID=A0AAU9E370_9FIRM|nr:hypothetical protein HLPR_11390 [Clostridia bacterium S502]
MKKLDAGVGEICIYGEISSYDFWEEDITPTNFKKDLDALGEIDTLNIYINSPGGSVFAGQAIYNIIKRHSANVIVYIDGLAASIASIIAMAGDKIVIPSNAMIMIHNAWTIHAGNADDFRKVADDLDKIGESLVAVYVKRTGLSEEEIKSMMDVETWLTGKEAIEKGFADEVEEEKQIAASLNKGILNINNQSMDLSRFKNAPKFFINNVLEKELQNQNELNEKEILSLKLDLI